MCDKVVTALPMVPNTFSATAFTGIGVLVDSEQRGLWQGIEKIEAFKLPETLLSEEAFLDFIFEAYHRATEVGPSHEMSRPGNKMT